MIEKHASDTAIALTPEAVAYQLLVHVLEAERRPLGDPAAKLSRTLILDAYAECLEAATGNRTKRPLRTVAAA